MNKQQEQLDTINDIKKLMDRSSRFSALSGLSGVVVGILALISTGINYQILKMAPFDSISYLTVLSPNGEVNNEILHLLGLNFALVLLVSFATAIWLSNKNAYKKGVKIGDLTAKRMMIHFIIPMLAGGAYCMILFTQNHIELIIPATLLFYGLALLNAGKYTVNDIKYLGVLLVILGLLSSIYTDQALLFWAIGFGLLHIIYGSLMYFKYEK